MQEESALVDSLMSHAELDEAVSKIIRDSCLIPKHCEHWASLIGKTLIVYLTHPGSRMSGESLTLSRRMIAGKVTSVNAVINDDSKEPLVWIVLDGTIEEFSKLLYNPEKRADDKLVPAHWSLLTPKSRFHEFQLNLVPHEGLPG